jgi:hypothetical protein
MYRRATRGIYVGGRYLAGEKQFQLIVAPPQDKRSGFHTLGPQPT